MLSSCTEYVASFHCCDSMSSQKTKNHYLIIIPSNFNLINLMFNFTVGQANGGVRFSHISCWKKKKKRLLLYGPV